MRYWILWLIMRAAEKAIYALGNASIRFKGRRLGRRDR